MIQLGLLGYPLEHSLSPRIHLAALDYCGLEGAYSLFPVAPDDHQGLKDLLARIRKNEIIGLNVTIPHKQNVIPLLDELSPTAKAIGAVNTISVQNGKLTGHNTDAPGFMEDLEQFIGNWGSGIGNRRLALVLGAGGSARAVVYALVNDGWEVTIAARRAEQARNLAAYYAMRTMQYDNPQLSTFNLIVNTTPVGMSPHTNASPWPADLPFPPNAAIYDLVYNPRETKLVRDACAAGLPAATGLGMLVEQAALAFEIWMGSKLQRDILYESVGATRLDWRKS